MYNLSRDGNAHGSGMSRATAVYAKPSFRAAWRVGVVGRGNAGWTTSKTTLPMPELFTRAWKRISAESSLLSPPPSPPTTTQSVKGLTHGT